MYTVMLGRKKIVTVGNIDTARVYLARDNVYVQYNKKAIRAYELANQSKLNKES